MFVSIMQRAALRRLILSLACVASVAADSTCTADDTTCTANVATAVADGQRVAFVAGASGAIGRELLSLMLADARYSRVIAAVRSKELTPQTFPLPIEVDRSRLVVLGGIDDYSTLEADALDGAQVVLTAMGTSRANAEVAADREAMGQDEGFIKWLKLVDVDYNVRLAELASSNGALIFGRVSSVGADSTKTGGGFNLYHKHQGLADEAVAAVPFPKGHVIMRPGRLDRGEELRAKRSWEVGHHVQMGPGLSVKAVAVRMLQEVDLSLEREAPTVTTVFDEDVRAQAGL